jgi:hypothetical protein
MDLNKLIAVVTILATLSIATERLLEIVKGLKPKWFEAKPDPITGIPSDEEEARKRTKISLLAVFCGIITAFLASPLLAGIFKNLFPEGTSCKLNEIFGMGNTGVCGFDLSANGIFLVIALGLLASGGSSLWNSILEYLVKVKDLKKSEANRTEAMTRIIVATARRKAIDDGVKLESEN